MNGKKREIAWRQDRRRSYNDSSNARANNSRFAKADHRGALCILRRQRHRPFPHHVAHVHLPGVWRERLAKTPTANGPLRILPGDGCASRIPPNLHHLRGSRHSGGADQHRLLCLLRRQWSRCRPRRGPLAGRASLLHLLRGQRSRSCREGSV